MVAFTISLLLSLLLLSPAWSVHVSITTIGKPISFTIGIKVHPNLT